VDIPFEGPDPKVVEFLRILEEYRVKCEEEGNYLEAGRAHKQLGVYMSMDICIYICNMYIDIYMYLKTHIQMSLRHHKYIYIYIYIYMCIYTYLCMYTYF
jgi:hypothetical protein